MDTWDEVEHKLYDKFVGKEPPKGIQCTACNWTGNKPKTIRFKNKTKSICCPNCGERVVPTVDIIFWRTANGFTEGISLQDIVDGKIYK